MISRKDNRLMILLLNNIVLMIIAAFSEYTIGQIFWAFLIEFYIIVIFIALSYFYVSLKHESLGRGIVKAGSFLFLASFFSILLDKIRYLDWIALDGEASPSLFVLAVIFFISHGYIFYSSAIKNHEKVAETMLDPKGALRYFSIPMIRISPIVIVSFLILIYKHSEYNVNTFGIYALVVLLLLKTFADVVIFHVKEESVFV